MGASGVASGVASCGESVLASAARLRSARPELATTIAQPQPSHFQEVDIGTVVQEVTASATQHRHKVGKLNFSAVRMQIRREI